MQTDSVLIKMKIMSFNMKIEHNLREQPSYQAIKWSTFTYLLITIFRQNLLPHSNKKISVLFFKF